MKGKSIISRLKRWVIGSIPVSLSAMSLTTPLSALYFGTVSLVGILTNLLTIWVLNFVFYGVVAACAMSFLSMPVSAGFAWILAWPIRYVLWIAKILASIPLAAVYTRSAYVVIWLIFIYCLICIFLMLRKKHPIVLVCCGMISLCLALLCAWLEPTMDDVRMTVMDVGQGQSILLQNEKYTFLVDCGGDSDDEAADVAAETLLSMGIVRLDGIIVTHGDRDHAGGIVNLLSRIKVDRVFFGANNDAAHFAAIEAATDGEVVSVSEDIILTFGESKITIFAPLFVNNSNENSLCVLFDTGKCDILITGDRGSLGEKMLLRDHDLQNVDVLIAGHHGSKYSTTEEFLMETNPEAVIISASAFNPYGHPAPEVLERLDKFGCRVFRTDIHGTIVYRR